MSYQGYYDPYRGSNNHHQRHNYNQRHNHRHYTYPPDTDPFARLLNWLLDRLETLMSSTDSSRQLTIAYAAGASLAAITLIYVFGPTFFIDGRGAGAYGYGAGSKGRKQTVVGLYNPANDCFVNSVLQALAGVGELRGYLVQRVRVQVQLEALEEAGVVRWKGRRPILTRALKTMLDRLNERPLYRKTITTRDFIYELERVFRSRISRNQQDAQEFLQIVAQTLAEEYEAQEKVKATVPRDVAKSEEKAEGATVRLVIETDDDEKVGGSATPKTEEYPVMIGESSGEEEEAKANGADEEMADESPGEEEESPVRATAKPKHIPLDVKTEDSDVPMTDEKEGETEEGHKIPEFGMPMEGKLESGIQCLVCGFMPKPTASTFVVLTLNVPQKSSATLDDCFNEHLSTEYIDDFQCAKCKLNRIIAVLEHKLPTVRDERQIAELTRSITALKNALETDPEKLPTDILLPPASATSVKSRIAKRTYFAHCPDVLAIHLSRSIFDYYSRKNSCKVAFPEEVELGPLLSRSKYKLLGLITHRGSHESGHYECYRRQNSHPAPYSTPMLMPVDGTPMSGSGGATPAASLLNLAPAAMDVDVDGATNTIEQEKEEGTATTTATGTPPLVAEKQQVQLTAAGVKTKEGKTAGKGKKSKSTDGRWWRISDDSVKEVKTADVLGLQKEVYLLFYEKERER
ncbi:Ubiquitin carboxyl-terminal hydrolase [Drechslerella dactyloides]|uniref:Ubiquitin carboxyl-terminal hydrolase n=1 Tax=Drechslerella dactyloides TaxID=74499 RepID=A0AAD6IZ48_DREDA|nr:Ubiquitin carboxyl-terminal hydrolase [Drechslerella dactyloides]